MRCQSPGCTAENEPRAISHAVVYRERTIVIHDVPAEVCPECGDVVIHEETIFHLGSLLGRKGRAKGDSFRYES